jgi:hypothetical protein
METPYMENMPEALTQQTQAAISFDKSLGKRQQS